jgi:hypothetical protein
MAAARSRSCGIVEKLPDWKPPPTGNGHDPAPAPQGPRVEPCTIDETLAVFRKWLILTDVTPIHAVLGTVAANLLPGDPVWLGLIGPPSSAKTEILNSTLRLPNVVQGDRVRRIGVLLGRNENNPQQKRRLSAFTQALAGLGWTDGRNLVMDLRWFGDAANRIPGLAQELVGLQPDIILVNGTPATVALQRETRTIPIVFAN